MLEGIMAKDGTEGSEALLFPLYGFVHKAPIVDYGIKELKSEKKTR